MYTVSVGDHLPTLLSDTDRFGYKVSQKVYQPSLVVSGIELLITRVNCGGQQPTLAKAVLPAILPLVISRIITLKRPYLHYHENRAA